MENILSKNPENSIQEAQRLVWQEPHLTKLDLKMALMVALSNIKLKTVCFILKTEGKKISSEVEENEDFVEAFSGGELARCSQLRSLYRIGTGETVGATSEGDVGRYRAIQNRLLEKHIHGQEGLSELKTLYGLQLAEFVWWSREMIN